MSLVIKESELERLRRERVLDAAREIVQVLEDKARLGDDIRDAKKALEIVMKLILPDYVEVTRQGA